MSLQGISVRLLKAILLKDAFTGAPVTNGIQIQKAAGKKILKKPEGYWLFLDAVSGECRKGSEKIPAEKIEIEITSPVYKSRTIFLEPDGGRDVEEVFLYPDQSYPVKPGSTAVYGRAPEESILHFHLEEPEDGGRLLHDYRKGSRQISIFMRGGADAGRRNWYIWDREKKRGEYFQAKKSEGEPEDYELGAPLKADYQKKDALIFPAYECLADKDGAYYLLLERLKVQDYELYYSYPDGRKEISGKTKITGLKQNKTDFFKE